MKVAYKSANPNAGIVSYEMLDRAIILEFKDGKFRYLYDTVSLEQRTLRRCSAWLSPAKV